MPNFPHSGPPPTTPPPGQPDLRLAFMARVFAERDRQVTEKGYTAEHDDAHGPADFARFIEERIYSVAYAETEEERQDLFVQIAALAHAGGESLLRQREADKA